MALPQFPIFNTRDSVVIFDNNYSQLFPDAKIIDVIIKEEAKIMEHPLETGSTIVDHAIINPVEIELRIYIPSFSYKNTYNVIKNLFKTFSLLKIQTNTGTYENQVISSMPHAENAEIFDSTIMTLKTKEALFIQPQYGTEPISPKDPKNSSTNDRGVQSGSAPTPALESEWKKQNRLAQR